uniref:Uncharacterized protein n=1 Tax=Pararge aegeria TaxID=116150 RepID=S4Q003_9NEOP
MLSSDRDSNFLPFSLGGIKIKCLNRLKSKLTQTSLTLGTCVKRRNMFKVLMVQARVAITYFLVPNFLLITVTNFSNAI